MDKKSRIRTYLVGAAVLCLALLYFFVDARHAAFLPRCPLFALTGLYCPGCGSQRALSALLHSDVAAAMGYNVLLVASLPLMLYAAAISVVNLFSYTPVRQKIFYNPVFTRIVLAVVLLFGILRNIPAFPFTHLAP